MPRQHTPPVLELRRYVLHPGAREALVEVFERAFVEGQEAHGMVLPGQFRDVDDPDSFVWLRQFTDMDARKAALAGFYGGPVWKANRDVANATMIAFDNVLLLKPVGERGFALDGLERPGLGTPEQDRGAIVATIIPLEPGAQFATLFQGKIAPLLDECGFDLIGAFETDPSPNTYPDLPVQDANVFVWFSRFSSLAGATAAIEWLEASPQWKALTEGRFDGLAAGKPEMLRLTPTPRSLLAGTHHDPDRPI